MQRRTLLQLGLTSAAALAVAGGAVAWLRPGLLPSGALSATGREVFAAVGRAALDKSLPDVEAARQIALQGLLARIDALVQALPPHPQAELSQLLSLLGTTPGRRAFARLRQPWREAAVADIQQALQGMRLSTLPLRQQAYGALHDISTGAYFSDPASWSMLGYPGPRKI